MLCAALWRQDRHVRKWGEVLSIVGVNPRYPLGLHRGNEKQIEYILTADRRMLLEEDQNVIENVVAGMNLTDGGTSILLDLRSCFCW